jgi:hypothetical protein
MNKKYVKVSLATLSLLGASLPANAHVEYAEANLRDDSAASWDENLALVQMEDSETFSRNLSDALEIEARVGARRGGSPSRGYPPRGGSGTTVGNSTYYSKGGSSTNVGNSTYYSNGGSSTNVGNSTYFSKGGSSTTVGNSTYYSNGGSATQVGNTTYFSKGGSCTQVGSSSYCS